MTSTKHVLFAFAMIGMIGAFVPFVRIEQRGISLELTAKELSFGLERTHKLIGYQLPAIAEAKLPPDVKSTRDDLRLVAKALKFSIALYVPIGIAMLVALLAQWRGRLGRGYAALAAFAGLVSAALWFVVRYALDYGLSEIELKRTTIALQIGAHLLLVAGAGAALAGIAGVIRPERPRVAMTPPPVPPPPGPAPY